MKTSVSPRRTARTMISAASYVIRQLVMRCVILILAVLYLDIGNTQKTRKSKIYN